MIKVLVIGDQNCGKTSIVNRFIHGTYDNSVQNTVACEYSLKMIEVDGVTLRMNIWDIAGQDRLGGKSSILCQ